MGGVFGSAADITDAVKSKDVAMTQETTLFFFINPHSFRWV